MTVRGTGRAVLELIDRRTAGRIGLGFLIAGLLIWLLVAGVGTDRLLAVLGRADPLWILAGCASTAVGLGLWAVAWRVVLRVVGVEVRLRTLVVTYYAATFANYVTPLGQAGGEPFIAYVLSRDTGASYEDSLASVVTADLLNLLPFFTFAGIGFAALLWQASLPPSIRPLAIALAAVGVAIPLLVALGWRFRRRLGRLSLRLSAPLTRRVDRLSRTGLRDRLRNLNAALERIAGEPRALATALVFSYLGWLGFALPLLTAAAALDLALAPLLVLFVVPASTVAGMVPSPGGLGGVEAALLVLLVAVAGFSQPEALATALVYRLESYWFALVLGASAALAVVARN